MADFPGIPFVPTPAITGDASSYAATFLPSGSAAPTFVTNRVWYVPGGFEVRWQTATPDTGGVSYPGPGVFGVDTTNYTVDDPSNVS